MKPVRIVLGMFAMLCVASPAQAGWDSAFQVTLFHRSTPIVSGYWAAPVVAHYPAPAVAHYADPCCPQPQQVCTTRYQQRCYYQPYTTYKTETYYEAVTSYRTSYYYEPVTTYRESCYFDPCTCTYKRTCTPVTSYRLRSQCCPVTSYVQRCGYVPVTSYRQCCYWEPQTCCSLVDPCTGQPITSPRVNESPIVPRVNEYRNGTSTPLYDRVYPPVSPRIEGSGSSWQPSRTNEPASLPQAPPQPKPIVPRYDRIALDTEAPRVDVNVVGQVVSGESIPANASETTLVFISDAPGTPREVVTPDRDGKFQVSLAVGSWRVYVRDGQAEPKLSQTVQVKAEKTQLTVLRK
jgi:hypothetical protein